MKKQYSNNNINGISPKSHEMAALMRLDLSSFICRSFQEINPQT